VSQKQSERHMILLNEPDRKTIGKAVRARQKLSEVVNVSAPKNRRRRPGEIPNRKTAIRWFCYECNGFESGGEGSIAGAVRACTAVECPLWPWRNGKLENDSQSL